jgi:glucosamine-6-phosphate deaminase
MEVVIVPDAATIGALAADAVVALLRREPTAVLGLATGSSPLVVYAELIRRYESGEVSFAHSRGFLLDEYVGLPAEHPQRYRSVIRRELEERVDFPPDAIAGPDGLADDLPAVCADYERAIADAGGVDLQLLGVGSDGHLAFNEPGSSLSSRTRIKTLTARTREDNARFFDSPDQVPHHVLT